MYAVYLFLFHKMQETRFEINTEPENLHNFQGFTSMLTISSKGNDLVIEHLVDR